MTMQNTALSLNSILNDGSSAQGTKKGAINLAALLGVGNTNTSEAFQSLLNALKTANGVTDSNPAKILSDTTKITGEQIGKTDALIGVDLETVLDPAIISALSPDVLEVLKTLDLQSISTLQFPTADLPEEIQIIGILDALSSAGHISDSDVYTLIEDPALASTLATLVTQLKSLQQAANSKASTTEPATKISGTIPSNVTSTSLLEAVQAIEEHLEFLSDTTITIDNVADLNLDQFQLLKKLAFADIAPYLAQPRKIRIDENTVAKVAQGPAFLTDTTTDITTLSATGGLVPTVAPQQTKEVQFIHDPLTARQLQNGAPDAALSLQAQTAAKPAQALSGTGLALSSDGTASGEQSLSNGFGSDTQGQQQFGTDKKNADILTNAKSTAQANTAGGASQNTAAQLAQSLPPSTTSNATNSMQRGFEAPISDGILSNLDSIFSASTSDDLKLAGLNIRADQTLPTNTATSLIAARSAGQPHPSTHLVSVALQRIANQSVEGQDREYIIRMDPPNMGRLKITLEFGKDNMIKAKLLAERPETLSLLQKDQHALERALQDSGLDTSDANALSFDLAEGDSFEQSMHDNTGQNGKNAKENGEEDAFGTVDAIQETVMPIFTDPVTGLTHVNIVI